MIMVALLLYDISAFKISNIFPIHLDKNNTTVAKTHVFFFLPWDCWTAPISRRDSFRNSSTFLLNGRYTQRPENHAEARISGLEINGTLPTWGTHPLGKILGSRGYIHLETDYWLSPPDSLIRSYNDCKWPHRSKDCIFLVMGYGRFTLCFNTEQL